MPEQRKDEAAASPHEGSTTPPHELDPARSKSVEAIEQEVDEIVEALEARRAHTRRNEAAVPAPTQCAAKRRARNGTTRHSSDVGAPDTRTGASAGSLKSRQDR